MFNKEMNFARNHIILNSLHHLLGGFGLAIILQNYFGSGVFFPVALAWIFVAFTVVVHAFEFTR